MDIIECFIQRDLGYTTQDIREAYKGIRDALLDDKIKRVVVIAHSQGGIIISSAIDNLLADLPRECISRQTSGEINFRLSTTGDLHICFGGKSF